MDSKKITHIFNYLRIMGKPTPSKAIDVGSLSLVPSLLDKDEILTALSWEFDQRDVKGRLPKEYDHLLSLCKVCALTYGSVEQEDFASVKKCPDMNVFKNDPHKFNVYEISENENNESFSGRAIVEVETETKLYYSCGLMVYLKKIAEDYTLAYPLSIFLENDYYPIQFGAVNLKAFIDNVISDGYLKAFT